MSQPPQYRAQEPQPTPAFPAAQAGRQTWPGPPPGGGAYGWAPQQVHASGAWAQPWPATAHPGAPVEYRSSAKAPVVLTLVALGALVAGGIAGFLIATVAFLTGSGAMTSVGMEEGLLGPVEEFPAVSPGDLGPDPVLDEYADACFAGEFQACDDLMYESPPLSEYEEYGLTCGGRVKPYDVMACTDLD